MLVSRRGGKALAERFQFQRDHAQLYESLGASMAEEIRNRMNRRLGPDVGEVRVGEIPVPVLVPLADGASPGSRPPLVMYGILLLSVALHLLSWIGAGDAAGLQGRLALPSGAGFSGVPKFALLSAPFLHGGIVSLAVGCLFLFVLGDNVEDRLGRVPFLLFYLFCGAIAGAAHVLWGTAGMPAALGSAGAVAGVLGAYLVFFPDVPIEMYGMGRVVHRSRLPLRVRLGGRRVPVGVGPGAPVESAQSRAVLPRGAPRRVRNGGGVRISLAKLRSASTPTEVSGQLTSASRSSTPILDKLIIRSITSIGIGETIISLVSSLDGTSKDYASLQ